MESGRRILLWSSIASALAIFLWLVTLTNARVPAGHGDSIRILAICLATNLVIVWTFFALAFVGRRVGFLTSLTDRSSVGRTALAVIGILSSLIGYGVGHLLVRVVWTDVFPRSIERSLNLDITVVPLVLGILLTLSTLLSLGVRTVRSTRMRLGIVFTLAFVPAALLISTMLVEELQLVMNAVWLPTVQSYRGPMTTPENEFTTVFVEHDVVNRGYLPEVVKALLSYQPEDLVILVQTETGSRNGEYTVSWHGIEPIVLDPPAGTRLAVGYAGIIPPVLQMRPEESLKVALRSIPRRLIYGDPMKALLYSTPPDDQGGSILYYMSERAGLPTDRFRPGDRHLINMHQRENERWGTVLGGDAMQIDVQRAGDSWTIVHDPQIAGQSGVVKYVYDRSTARIVPLDPGPVPTLERLKGRRIVVDAVPQSHPSYGNFLGLALVTDLVNARHGLGFRYVPGWLYVGVALFLQFLALFFFLRFRAMIALWMTVLVHAILAAVMVILFVELNVLVAPMFLWIPSLLVGGVLFINTFLREQREAVEERTRLETELNTARQMQLGLMPANDPSLQGFEVAGLCRPANEVGGDFYAYLGAEKHPSSIGIAVADVSGKAMKAAVTAIMTSGMLYEAAGRTLKPNEILDAVNTPLHERSDKRVFTAMVLANLMASGTKRTLTLSNAGQTPPLLVRKGKVTSLMTTGVRFPLGLKSGVQYPKKTFRLQAGDLVFFYTDGLTEATSLSGEAYGDARLETYLRSASGRSAREIVSGSVADLQSFRGDRPLPDDVTVVVVKVVGGKA